MLNLEIIGEGATTKVYRDGNKAIKLYVNAPHDEAENEAKLQAFAYNAGLPVPAVFGVRKISENETALDMEYIQGLPLIHAGMDKNERSYAIGTLSKLQCMMHGANAVSLPKQSDKFVWRIERSQYLYSAVKQRLLDLLRRLDRGKTNLCHGDFHPLNILYDGEKHWIIDWVDASCGDPLADACRTYVIFRQYLSRSSGIYLRSFCKEAKARQEDVLAWMPIVAASRMSENMGGKERAFLLKIVNEWYNSKINEET